MSKTIRVPNQGKDPDGNEGEIVLTFGDPANPIRYPVENGEIVVDDRHATEVLSSVPGAQLKPEAPVKE